MNIGTEDRFRHYDKAFRRCSSRMILPPHVMSAISVSLRGRFLDIGTGEGTKLERILDCSRGSFAGGVALEPSPLADEAREKVTGEFGVEVLPVSFEAYHDERPFDTILLLEVLEHIPREAHDFVLEKIVSMLKPSGTLIASTPNRPIYRMKCLLGEFDDPTHVAELNFSEFRDLLTAHFESADYYGTIPWMKLVRTSQAIQWINSLVNPIRSSHALYAICQKPIAKVPRTPDAGPQHSGYAVSARHEGPGHK